MLGETFKENGALWDITEGTSSKETMGHLCVPLLSLGFLTDGPVCATFLPEAQKWEVGGWTHLIIDQNLQTMSQNSYFLSICSLLREFHHSERKLANRNICPMSYSLLNELSDQTMTHIIPQQLTTMTLFAGWGCF